MLAAHTGAIRERATQRGTENKREHWRLLCQRIWCPMPPCELLEGKEVCSNQSHGSFPSGGLHRQSEDEKQLEIVEDGRHRGDAVSEGEGGQNDSARDGEDSGDHIEREGATRGRDGHGGGRGERGSTKSRGGNSEGVSGHSASLPAAMPSDNLPGETGEEDEARHAERASESRELCGRESKTESESGQGLSPLRAEELYQQGGDDNPRQSNSSQKDHGQRFVNVKYPIAHEFAHHKHGMARLNNGSFGSCPQSVLAAQSAWSQLWLRQPDEFYFGPLEEGLRAARLAVANVIHAPVEEVVLVENVTAVASMVALDVMWAFVEGRYNKGDSILMLNFTYGAVKKAFKAYASRAGAKLFEVKLPFPVISNEQIIQTFEEALKREKEENPSGRIRMAVFDHIVSMPTMILPVQDLVRLCRNYGVDQIFIDGAHGIGNLDLNMSDIDADYYMSNVHKWMLAPITAAFLHCKSQHLSRLHHPIISHNYGTGLVAECAWIGSRDYSALLAIPAAIEFVQDVAGSVEAYGANNHQNVVAMAEMLAQAWGTHLGTPPELCAAMAMVGLPPTLTIHSQAEALSMRRRLRHEFQVEVPLFYAGDLTPVASGSGSQDSHEGINTYARISHQIYNKPEEYYALRDAVNGIATKISLSHCV